MMLEAGEGRRGVTEVEWPNGAMEGERYGGDSAVGWKGMVMLSCSDALWSFLLKMGAESESQYPDSTYGMLV